MKDRGSAIDLIIGWRALIYRATFAAVVVSVVVSLLMPNWYRSSATCMPPQEGESRGGLISMFSEFGLDFGAGSLVSSTPMTDITLGILKSRLLKARIVDQFDLVTVYGDDSREQAISDLEDHLDVTTTPEGFIQVRVEDRSRQRAADMANAFMGFLDEYSRERSIEQATRTKQFIESALEQNADRLAAATQAMQAFQEEHGTIDLSAQTKATVDAMAELGSEKARLEVERGVLQGFSGPDQTRMREIDAQLRVLSEKLAEFAGAPGDTAGQSGGAAALLPLSGIPRLASRLADLTRDVAVQEKVRAYLSSQLEEARIQQAKDLEVIHVVDKAVPPLRKARPRRSLVVIMSVLLVFVGSVGLAFVSESFLDYTDSRHSDSGFAASREARIIRRALLRLRKWGGPTKDDEPA